MIKEEFWWKKKVNWQTSFLMTIFYSKKILRKERVTNKFYIFFFIIIKSHATCCNLYSIFFSFFLVFNLYGEMHIYSPFLLFTVLIEACNSLKIWCMHKLFEKKNTLKNKTIDEDFLPKIKIRNWTIQLSNFSS